MHYRFVWRQQSSLLGSIQNINTAIASPSHSVDDVLYIKDVNCESTLRVIQQAINHGVEFCVHGESMSDIEARTPKELENLAGEPYAYLQCMSSGSNGQPKRIRRTHTSWINSFEVTLKQAKLTNDDSYAIVGRPSHSLALYAALEAAWIGADIHALSDLRPDKKFSAMTELASTVLYATPTQLRQLCSSAIKLSQTNTQLQHIFCGGGKLDQHTYTQLATHFPQASVKEFYGASETSFITISDETTPLESVGKLYPGVELNIKPIDSERHSGQHTNEVLATGTVGEMWVKSPYLFEAYADGHEQHTRWHNGYLCIGELGYTDNNGHVFLTGRRSRMVNIADNMVFPEQIEHFFNGLDAVQQCALIPVHDATRGVVLIAIVEAQESDALRLQLLKLSRAAFGALKAPRDIVFVDTLPLLASGKPDLTLIEQQFTKP